MANHIISNVDSISVANSYYCDSETCNKMINSSMNSLKIITQNIRSIYKNFDSFQAQLATLSFEIDIIILTECWLNDRKRIPILDSYEMYCSKTRLNQNGGIVIYIKKYIKCTVEEPESTGAEFLLLKIHPDIFILAVYRSPSFYCINSFLNSLDNIIRPIKTKNFVIAGDVNIDIKTNNSDRNSTSYLNLIAELGLLPSHLYPTRFQNCLDHIMLNTCHPASVFVMNSSVTDHDSVLLCISRVNQRNERVNCYTSINYEAAIKHLETVDFSFINSDLDANKMATILVETISETLKLHSKVLNRPCRKRLLKPWLTPGLLRCIRHRNKLHSKSSKEPQNKILEITYKRYRNFCNTLLKKIKRNYEKSLLQNSKNNKEKWNAIKSITDTNKQKTSAEQLISTTKSGLEAVNHINHYFANIGKQLADDIKQIATPYTDRYEVPTILNSIVLLPPDEAEVESLIMNLKNDCSVGWDSIPAKFLKLAKHIMVPHLTKLFELCFTQGVFPKVFKKSLITPVHKGGLKDDVRNYRPISVLTTMSKILEIMLNSRLVNYLEHNNILSDA